MANCKDRTYSRRIKWRIRIGYLLLTAMTAYMVFIAEMGGGDSRMMTPLASDFSRLIFFGGMIYIIAGIVRNKKLLGNRLLLKERQLEEQDERNRFLHDKSGGLVMDVLLVCLLFITWTASMFDMAAFHTSFAVLMLAAGLKAAAYYWYSRFPRHF